MCAVINRAGPLEPGMILRAEMSEARAALHRAVSDEPAGGRRASVASDDSFTRMVDGPSDPTTTELMPLASAPAGSSSSSGSLTDPMPPGHSSSWLGGLVVPPPAEPAPRPSLLTLQTVNLEYATLSDGPYVWEAVGGYARLLLSGFDLLATGMDARPSRLWYVRERYCAEVASTHSGHGRGAEDVPWKEARAFLAACRSRGHVVPNKRILDAAKTLGSSLRRSTVELPVLLATELTEWGHAAASYSLDQIAVAMTKCIVQGCPAPRAAEFLYPTVRSSLVVLYTPAVGPWRFHRVSEGEPVVAGAPITIVWDAPMIGSELSSRFLSFLRSGEA
jgi:hypothetical protein